MPMSASLFPGLITVGGLLIVLAMAYRTLFQVKAELKAKAATAQNSQPHPAE
jgi:hypothetical protein